MPYGGYHGGYGGRFEEHERMGATRASIPRGPLTDEEKAAKLVIQKIGHLTFSMEIFTYALIVKGGQAMQRSLLAMAKAIIYDLSRQDDITSTEFTREARRIWHAQEAPPPRRKTK